MDQYFREKPISFLKADIEAYEYPMLRGARNVIARDKPKMAISIYHNPSDMFRIALELKRIDPDYALAVRQHGYALDDTVLYAWK